MTQSNETNRLFRIVADGMATPDEFRQLESLLEKDKTIRQDFIRFMGSEADLYEIASDQSVPPPNLFPKVGIASWKWSGSMIGGLLMLLLMVVYLLFAFSGGPDAVENQLVQYRPSDLFGQREIAVVRFTDDLFQHNAPASLCVGMPLKPGSLTFESGTIEIEFYCGAVVTLEGPAEFHLLSMDEASLMDGKAAALVGPSGHGFMINSRDIGVVDLGTEFAMTVSKEGGTSHVHVYEGEVEVSLLSDHGNTSESMLLTESNSVLVEHGSNQIDVTKTSFPMTRVRKTQQSNLEVTDDYVKSVVDSKPMIYWRFEDVKLTAATNHRVLNEMGDFLHGDFVGSVDTQALMLRNGAVWFEESSKPRYVATDRPITGNDWVEYTIEFWVKAKSLDWGAMVGIEGFDRGRSHISLVEIAKRTPYVHQSGAARFLHRQSMGESGGINLFSSVSCVPERWHYIVAVKSPLGIKLQIDEASWFLSESGVKNETDDSMPAMKVVLGALDCERTIRQFVGQLDEVAIYDRALGQDEIDRHYHAMDR